MIKRVKQLGILVLCICFCLIVSACNKSGDGKQETPTGTPDLTGEQTPTAKPTESATPTVTTSPTPTHFEYNPSEDRVNNMNFSDEAQDKFSYVEKEDTGTYDVNFLHEEEAEDAVLAGNCFVSSGVAGFSGSGYVEVKGGDTGDAVTITVEVPADGTYTLMFRIATPYGEKTNIALLDGETVGYVECKRKLDSFIEYELNDMYMTKGAHEITFQAYWGYVRLDKITVAGCEQMQEEEKTFDKAVLSDPYASENAQRLYQFICDINGLYTLSGQYGDYGKNSNELVAIYEATGRYPAVLGLDLMDYSPSRVANGTNSMAIERAMKYYRDGGIVTFSWHWNAPTEYLLPDQNWWSGFYEYATNISLDDIMSGKDSKGYDALISDIDAIAFQLKKLADEDVPILFRPLHEASGGWFWWGDCKAESFQKLWILLYERLTEYHGIHNLIWVYNGQAADWYPGDAYVDIVGEDIYPGEHVYGSQAVKYWEADAYTDKKLPVALTENGCLFDPDLALRDNALWTWFCTWGGEFVVDGAKLSEKYTELSMLQKVYSHENVITLDELPDLTTYGD